MRQDVLRPFFPDEQLRLLLASQRCVDRLGDFLVQPPLFPDRPEFNRCADRAVLGLVHRHRHEHLAVDEQARNAVVLLVADVLADRLPNRVFVHPAADIRFLTLDDHQRNTVYEQHEVGTVCLLTTGALDGEFLGDVIDIVLRVLPINVPERETFCVAENRLRQGFAEAEQIIHFLVRADQPVEHEFLQRVDAGADVVFAERIN